MTIISLNVILYIITPFGKSLRLFFPFWTQISYCNRESSVVQCKSIYDKVQRPVLLSSRRTPSCRSVSFLFLIMCYCLKNSRGLHPKAPFKICAVRFTLARGVCNSLNLCNELFPTESLVATHT